MDLKDARPGAAVELPQGLYALAAVTHCRATALEWLVFELAADEATAPQGTVPGGPTQSATGGCPRPPTLALVADQLYTATRDEADAWPDAAELTVDDVTYRLRHQGEARGERTARQGHAEFWLGRYRHYECDGRVLIFMDVHGATERLTGEAMDVRLVRVYE